MSVTTLTNLSTSSASTRKPARCVAVDATNRLHVIYHGCQGRATVHEMLTTFWRQLEALATTFAPTWSIAAFDSKPSFRVGLDSDYKAHRGNSPPMLVEFLQLAFNELPYRVPFERVCVPGMEADDVLASAAFHVARSNHQAILVTADKDVNQCLRSGLVTRIDKLSIDKGRLNYTAFTEANLIEKFGIPARRFATWQTIVGDNGDGVVGIPGIGEKTASEMLRDRDHSIEYICEFPEAFCLTHKQVASCKAFAKRAPIVKQLVTLRTDLEQVYEALK